MTRLMWAVMALGVGAGGALAGDDETVPLGRFKPTAGGFGGGVTATAAIDLTDRDPAAGDTDSVHYRRGGYGFHYGYGYGYSVSFYRPAYTYYRPVYTSYYYARPVYYYPAPVYYAAPVYYPCANAITVAPTVSLAMSPAPAPYPMPSATPMTGNSFRYDGGPSNPIPQPMPDKPGTNPPQKIEPASDSTSVPVSLLGKKSAYKYPAYGDKK